MMSGKTWEFLPPPPPIVLYNYPNTLNTSSFEKTPPPPLSADVI